MKQNKFKMYIFIIPILILIAVFSLWPIARSFYYTLFDYKLNDQQKSNLYLKAHFNNELFQENVDYVIYYLEDDRELVESEEKEAFTDLINYVSDYKDKRVEIKGQTSLSDEERNDFYTFIDKVDSDFKTLYSRNKDVSFYNEENLSLVINQTRTCIIDSNYIGLKGYKNLLSDNRLFIAFNNTIIFTFSSVFIEFILGLALALIMNKAIKGIGMVRTVSLIPWAIPTAVSALMWSYLYDGSSGIVAKLFEILGFIRSAEELLLTSHGAMISSILADVWKTTPYMALLILAGLQTIPDTLYESSSLDGANKVQTFCNITMPLLKPSILVALLFRTLDAFRVFDLIYVLTGGGPGGSTETLSIYAYKLMFAQTNFGYGSIVVLFMFICVALIATLFVKILGADLMAKN